MRLSEQIAEALLSEKTWAVPSYELAQIQKADATTLRSLRKIATDKLERLERGTTVGWGSSNYEIDHGQTTAKLKAIDDRLKQLGESRLSEAKPPRWMQVSDKHAAARKRLLAARKVCPDCKAAQQKAIQYGELRKGFGPQDLYCPKHRD